MDALTTPGDFTGDGRDDLLTRTDGVLRLYPGNGRGGFGRVVTYGGGWIGSPPWSVRAT